MPRLARGRGPRFAWATLAVAVILACWAIAAGAQTNAVSTVAGTGTAGPAGDGGPASGAQLNFPISVSVTPDRGYLIADQINHKVRRVGPEGTITTIAGNGTAGFGGDGGRATDAQFNAPSGVAQAPDGSVLVADANNNRIRRIGTDGIITTVAGTGAAGYNGDGKPAVDSDINFPYDVAFTSDGGFLIADVDNNRVRKVLNGTISTFAGTGQLGGGGDNGPATSAQLNDPFGVAVAGDGTVLIADTGNNRVRRVSPGGTITTDAGIAGGGGFSGDGGPARMAQLNGPARVALTADGGYLIADRFNHRIRRVAPDGTISTAVGTGTAGFNGDGNPATGTDLNTPVGVAVTDEGDWLVADTFNHRIRFVDAAAPALRLEPDPQTRTTGETASVDAVLEGAFGAPLAGRRIRYSIEGGNPGSGETVTGSNGRAAISWLGRVPGDDVVTAFADLDDDNNVDPGEPASTASVSWTGVGVPEAGEDVVLTNLRGDVFVDPPPGVVLARNGRTAGGQAPRGFVRITRPVLIPVGSVVNVAKGSLQMTAAADLRGRTQLGSFSKGSFRLRQRRASRPITELQLSGGSFRGCPRSLRRSRAAGSPRRRIRRLSGSSRRGRFRTRGRHGSATVRGTRWVMEDRCDGTLTKVSEGSVTVRDFARRRNVVVRRGQRYLARPRGR